MPDVLPSCLEIYVTIDGVYPQKTLQDMKDMRREQKELHIIFLVEYQQTLETIYIAAPKTILNYIGK